MHFVVSLTKRAYHLELPVAQRPTSFSHDRIQFHSESSRENKDQCFLLGDSSSSANIVVHNVELGMSERVSSSAILSASASPSMMSAAIDSTTFPVVDPGCDSLVGACLYTSHNDIANGRFLFQLSMQGDLYAQEIQYFSRGQQKPRRDSNKTADLPCGASGIQAFSRTSSLQSSVGRYDKSTSLYPLRSSNFPVVVPETDIQKFDVMIVDPESFRIPIIPAFRSSISLSEPLDETAVSQHLERHLDDIKYMISHNDDAGRDAITLWEVWRILVDKWQHVTKTACLIHPLLLRKALNQSPGVLEVHFSSSIEAIEGVSADGIRISSEKYSLSSCHCHINRSIYSNGGTPCGRRHCLLPHLVAYRFNQPSSSQTASNSNPDPHDFGFFEIGSVTKEMIESLREDWGSM